jgi:hypothetical protein
VSDVVINKPFKDHLQQLYSDWLVRGNLAITLSGKLRKPSISVLGEWILIAWERIIVTGVKKCCISNALDGTEDDFLRKDDENKDSACEEDGGSGGGDEEEHSGNEISE